MCAYSRLNTSAIYRHLTLYTLRFGELSAVIEHGIGTAKPMDVFYTA
jgi:hypothetical protein